MRVRPFCAALATGLLLTTVSVAQTPPAAPTSGTEGAQAAADVNPVVMKVNGDPIYASDIQFTAHALEMQAQRGGHQMSQDQITQFATEQVVGQKLLVQEARREKVQVDEKQLEQKLQQIEKRVGGHDQFVALLQQSGTTLKRYQQTAHDQELISEFKQSRIMPKVSVTDAEVKKFYDDNPNYFEKPEEVRAQHILIKVPPNATEAQKKEAKAKAEAARQRALKGEDFSALAKELSEGPSAPRGGELGFFDRNTMVKPFADAAFALKVGEISPVVETQFGYHVIKVEEHRPAHKQSLDEVQLPIRNYLTQEKVNEQLTELVNKLKSSAKIERLEPPQAAASHVPASKEGEKKGPHGS